MAPALPARDPGEIQQKLTGAARADSADAFSRQVLTLLSERGAASRTHLTRIGDGGIPEPARALADCVHFLAILHGELPSLFELAREDDTASSWLGAVASAFENDRRWLARLVVVTGGAVDLAGLTATEQIVRDQRAALLTLGASSRHGCAFGAALTLSHDWTVLRRNISAAAARVHGGKSAAPAADWPIGGAESALSVIGADDRVRRAVTFGASQLAGLHGQLFDLLEARHALRLP